jgi:hypothetical protein
MAILWFSGRSGISFDTRRLIFALVPILLLVVEGVSVIAAGGQGLLQRIGGPVWRIRTFGGIALIALSGLVILGPLKNYYQFQEKPDFKRVAQWLLDASGPNDLIVAWKPEHLDYYLAGSLEMANAWKVSRGFESFVPESGAVWVIRPRAAIVRKTMAEVERWLDEAEAVDVRFGQGLFVSFVELSATDQRARLEGNIRRLERAERIKPRAYVHRSLIAERRKLEHWKQRNDSQ